MQLFRLESHFHYNFIDDFWHAVIFDDYRSE
jgi:hypothetical protein